MTFVFAILVFGMTVTLMVFAVAAVSMMFAAFMCRIFLDILRLLVIQRHNGRSLNILEILLRTWSVMPLTHGVKVAHDDLILLRLCGDPKFRCICGGFASETNQTRCWKVAESASHHARCERPMTPTCSLMSQHPFLCDHE